MKSTKLSIVAAVAVMGMFCGANADEINSQDQYSKKSYDNIVSEIFTNGKVKGDVSVTYETRNFEEDNGNYYRDSAYSVGSAEIIYQTAAFHNFSLAYGARGYRVLWEDNDDINMGVKGKGDAAIRFYDINNGSVTVTTNAFLAYDTKNVHIKAGRHELNTEWMDETHDAISIYATPTDKINLELIWSLSHYRMWNRELYYGPDIEGTTGKINVEGGGLYKAGITYKINDMFKTKAYALHAPDNYSVYGGKFFVDKKINSDVKLGGYVHYMQTNEERTGKEDGEMSDTRVYVDYKGLKASIGYLTAGDKGGWGSAKNGGENVNPFEEGDKSSNIDARTVYMHLSKKFGDFKITGLYGIIDYRNTINGPEYQRKEFNIFSSYDITKKLKLGVILTLDDPDSENGTNSATDMTQLSTTLAYKF